MTNDLQRHAGQDIIDRSPDPVAPIASQSLFWRARYLAASPSLGALPLLFWLSENIRPAIGVTLGTADAVPHFALCQAVEKLGLEAMCFGIGMADEAAEDPAAIQDYNETHYGDFSLLSHADHEEVQELLDEAQIDLLIVNRPATQALQEHIDTLWLPRLSDRAVVLFLRGGDNLRDYAASIARGAGQFSFDARKGICLALRGDRQGDRLSRLCQLRVGQPGYLAVRNIFARAGELHSKTYELGRRDMDVPDPAQLAALETQLSERDASCRLLTDRLDRKSAELESTRAEIAALQGARGAPSDHSAGQPDIDATPQGGTAAGDTGEAEELRARLHKSEQELEARFEDIAVLGGELKKLSTELEETRKRAAGHMRDLEDASRDPQGKDHDLALLRNILQQTERERDEARQRVMDLEASSSWRITSPLRRASLMVRRGKDDP